ncbi:hypothetical protein LTR17_016576 [Elasticomyces elasticus]|nr:hypothetical protein LTR17_016576 [Elasticomyces elasticus]
MAHTYTYTDPPPDTTAAPPPPSNTVVLPPIPSSNPERTGHCIAKNGCHFKDVNCFPHQDGIIKMGEEVYGDAVSAFCRLYEGLPPSVPGYAQTWDTIGPGIFDKHPTKIVVRADWAEDQTGCGDKKDFWFTQHAQLGFICALGWRPLFECGVNELQSYGGWYIMNTTDSGCLKFSLYAEDLANPVEHFAVGFNGSADNSTMASGMGWNGSHLVPYRAA